VLLKDGNDSRRDQREASSTDATADDDRARPKERNCVDQPESDPAGDLVNDSCFLRPAAQGRADNRISNLTRLQAAALLPIFSLELLSREPYQGRSCRKHFPASASAAIAAWTMRIENVVSGLTVTPMLVPLDPSVDG
jgi:hypothetical protein